MRFNTNNLLILKIMNVIRKMKFGVAAMALATVFTACSSDDDATLPADKGSLKIMAKATYNETANKGMENIMLSNFWINIKEIELERQKPDTDDLDFDEFFNGDDDVELKGPWEVDLLSKTSIELAKVMIPNGIYEEVEFEFDKSENSESPLYNKSMMLKGKINDKDFIFWHDFEEEIEIDYEDKGKSLVINNDSKEIFIDFDLAAVLSQVNLESATDNDGDGVITISPTDADGNNALAKLLKEAIKNQIDLMD